MTAFGKFIFGLVGIALASAIFYGIRSYVESDNIPPVANTTTQEVVATTTEAGTSTPLASSTETLTGSTTVASSSGKQTKKIPFTDFIKKGGSYVCAVTQTMASITTTGTVYLHDKKIRANFSSALAGQTINSSMVISGGYIYSWTDKAATGNKVKVASNTGGAKLGTLTWNGSQVGDYNCAEWTADDTTFDLPKDVTFAEAKKQQ